MPLVQVHAGTQHAHFLTHQNPLTPHGQVRIVDIDEHLLQGLAQTRQDHVQIVDDNRHSRPVDGEEVIEVPQQPRGQLDAAQDGGDGVVEF